MSNKVLSRQPAVIITGMHRSGTSLTASMLQNAGLDIGEKLLEANSGNPKGYFENLDFFHFHQEALSALGLAPEGWALSQIDVLPEYYVNQARLLIQKNASTSPWGWKEPRTVLFLNFWRNLLSEGKYVFVYRSPWEVMDSLYRRGDPIFHHNPEFALKIWFAYNQIILNFCHSFPERCLLFHIDTITSNPDLLVKSVREKLEIPLKSLSDDLYDASLLTKEITSQRSTLIKHFFPNAFELYQELNTLAQFTDAYAEDEHLLLSTSWVLQDWLDIRKSQREYKYELEATTQQQILPIRAELDHLRIERDASIAQQAEQIQQLQQQLQESQQELQDIQEELSRTQNDLRDSKAELEQCKALVTSQSQQLQDQLEIQSQLERFQLQLLQTENDLIEVRQDQEVQRFRAERFQHKLQEVREKLQEVRGRFQRSKTNLANTRQELEDTRNELAAMKTSKFWKLRSGWVGIRKSLGIKGD